MVQIFYSCLSLLNFFYGAFCHAFKNVITCINLCFYCLWVWVMLRKTISTPRLKRNSPIFSFRTCMVSSFPFKFIKGVFECIVWVKDLILSFPKWLSWGHINALPAVTFRGDVCELLKVSARISSFRNEHGWWSGECSDGRDAFHSLFKNQSAFPFLSIISPLLPFQLSLAETVESSCPACGVLVGCFPRTSRTSRVWAVIRARRKARLLCPGGRWRWLGPQAGWPGRCSETLICAAPSLHSINIPAPASW